MADPETASGIEDLELESNGVYYGDPENNVVKRNPYFQGGHGDWYYDKRDAGSDRMNHLVRFFKRGGMRAYKRGRGGTKRGTDRMNHLIRFVKRVSPTLIQPSMFY